MSAFWTVAGVPVVQARLSLPLIGVWWADFVLETDDSVSGLVESAIGPWKMYGTVLRWGTSDGSTVLRIKGGAGGMAKEVGPQAYYQPTFSVPLSDIMAKSGEALSSVADKTLQQQSLEAFHVQQTSCGKALKQLCDVFGANWRVLPNGTVWVGFEQWSEVSVPAEVLSSSPQIDRISLNLNVPLVLPGNKLFGRKVSRVDYSLDAGSDLGASVVFQGD